MSRTKRYLLIAAAALGVFVAACFVMFLIARRDEPPPDTSDLAVAWEEIDPAENAYTYLVAADNLVVEFNDPWPPADYIDWPQDLVDKTLADNAAALKQLDKAMACSHFQLPAGNFAVSAGYGCELRKFAELVSLRASDRFRKGREAEAMDDALLLLHLACHVEAGQCCIGPYFEADCMADAATDRLRTFAERSEHLDAGPLKAAAVALGACSPREEDYANALRVEYQTTANSIDDLAQGKATMQQLGWRQWATYAQFEFTSPYWFKPNATKRLFAEATRAQIAATALPTQKSQVLMKEWWNHFRQEYESFVPWFFLPVANRTGKLIYFDTLGSGQSGIGRHSSPPYYAQMRTIQGMNQLIIALKAYKVENGRLPEKIEDLVPEYLKALPLDEFDGKPLRYSREKQVVYSVGKDGKDSGGMTKEEMRAWAREQKDGLSYFNEDLPDAAPSPWVVPNPSLPIKF